MVNIDKDWPFYFSDNLIKGNVKSNVAICSLWTLKEIVTKGIDKENFAIAGNLYYNEGINYLLRTVLSNPNIRYIVLCGIDITKSGEMLVKLMENGINEQHIISETFQIENEIPVSAIENFRKNVKVIDMRGTVDSKKILETIKTLHKLPAFAEPKIFPMPPVAAVETLSSEKTGFVVREKKVADAWRQILNLVMKFGTIKKSQHSSDQRELVNLVAIVEDDDPDNPSIEKWLWFGKDELENYYPKIMTGKIPEGTEYTYGNRLLDYDIGKNQIDYIINDLRKTKYSRRAIAVTWQHDKDMHSANPPCWVVLQALVQDDKLYLTCYLRSNDMFSAWPLNAFGLRKIQKHIAESLGILSGPLTTVSCSAHIYQHDWSKATKILEKYKILDRFVPDPRGNFVIKLDRDNNEIIIDYYTSDMKKAKTLNFKINEKGNTYISIYKKIMSMGLVSQLAHAADLGAELAKAELALRYGLKYSQDDPLDAAFMPKGVGSEDD